MTNTNRGTLPIVLVFGPSGAGKSTVCDVLSGLRGWLHVETDPYSRHADSLALPESLAQVFSSSADFAVLATELRAMTGAHRGVVLSFVSMACLNSRQLAAAQRAGFVTVLLFGDPQDCLRSFLRREAGNGRNLNEAHWQQHNQEIYKRCRRSEYQAHKLVTFSGGAHRPIHDIVAEVQARAASPPVPARARLFWR